MKSSHSCPWNICNDNQQRLRGLRQRLPRGGTPRGVGEIPGTRIPGSGQTRPLAGRGAVRLVPQNQRPSVPGRRQPQHTPPRHLEARYDLGRHRRAGPGYPTPGQRGRLRPRGQAPRHGRHGRGPGFPVPHVVRRRVSLSGRPGRFLCPGAGLQRLDCGFLPGRAGAPLCRRDGPSQEHGLRAGGAAPGSRNPLLPGSLHPSHVHGGTLLHSPIL